MKASEYDECRAWRTKCLETMPTHYALLKQVTAHAVTMTHDMGLSTAKESGESRIAGVENTGTVKLKKEEGQSSPQCTMSRKGEEKERRTEKHIHQSEVAPGRKETCDARIEVGPTEKHVRKCRESEITQCDNVDLTPLSLLFDACRNSHGSVNLQHSIVCGGGKNCTPPTPTRSINEGKRFPCCSTPLHIYALLTPCTPSEAAHSVYGDPQAPKCVGTGHACEERAGGRGGSTESERRKRRAHSSYSARHQ